MLPHDDITCMDLVTLGDPILRKPANRVTKVGKSVRELVKAMFATMYANNGIGLAAPQVGVSKQVIVVDTGCEEDRPLAMINPRIVEAGSRLCAMEEGCLSMPGLRATVLRPETVVVQGLSVRGEPMRIQAAELLARVLQHEIDHLNGVLFIDHLQPAERARLLDEYRKLHAVALAEEA